MAKTSDGNLAPPSISKPLSEVLRLPVGHVDMSTFDPAAKAGFPGDKQDAPGITDAETQRFVDAITEMHDSDAWQQVLEDQGWTDAFLTGDDFSSYLDEESSRVEGVLGELGLS